jgi:hypothetical protein
VLTLQGQTVSCVVHSEPIDEGFVPSGCTHVFLLNAAPSVCESTPISLNPPPLYVHTTYRPRTVGWRIAFV